jgi:hypothetical protein
MSKKFFAVTLAMAFMVSTAVVSFAGSVDCTVKSVSGNTVTLDCGKKANKLKEGSDVKVKAAKKKAVEGC